MVQVHVAESKDTVGALAGAFVAEASAKAIAAKWPFYRGNIWRFVAKTIGVGNSRQQEC